MLYFKIMFWVTLGIGLTTNVKESDFRGKKMFGYETILHTTIDYYI